MSVSPTATDLGFSQFRLAANLERGINALGFTDPRPIQAHTIPAALEGRDVLGLAQTGTGKTAAFALPILARLNETRATHPRALILAPTRELTLQIQTEISALAQFTRVTAITVFGGVPAGPQIRALRARPDIIVACPGRLLDLMQQRVVDLAAIEVLVLDEADHMFDMGFLPSVKRILAALPARRQNLMFSATMPSEIRTLANQVLQRPHVVELSHSRPAETIEHALYPVASDRKVDLLRHFLAQDDFTSAIVFLRTKHRAKRLANDLSTLGHRAVALQGNMSQSQRQRAMSGFRDGSFDILVATDIAARGIDVANVSHVINFDVPDTPDAYTHRIGRTGRAECSGKAFTLVCHDDHIAVRDIERKLGGPIDRRTLPGFESRGQSAAPSNGARPERPDADRRRNRVVAQPKRGRFTGPSRGRSAKPSLVGGRRPDEGRPVSN